MRECNKLLKFSNEVYFSYRATEEMFIWAPTMIGNKTVITTLIVSLNDESELYVSRSKNNRYDKWGLVSLNSLKQCFNDEDQMIWVKKWTNNAKI